MTTTLWSRSESATDWGGLDPHNLRSTALLRLLRGFMTARCFVAVVLVALQVFSWWIGTATPPVLLLVLAASYLAATLVGWRFARVVPPIRSFSSAWFTTIAVDLLAFALLQFIQVGNINYAPLFALPVLMAAVLGTVTVGLGTTAIATLLLLADATWHWVNGGGDSTVRFVQAALTGTGLFVVALLAHELALRLAREESMALRSRSTARLHALVSDLVIETLSEGVLVIDAKGLVHAANPAAENILGQDLSRMDLPFALDTHPAWQALALLARQTFARSKGLSQEIPVAQSQGKAREVRVRTRLTPSIDHRIDGLCVMFLQDLRELEARIRTEKLAAMGRMSAAVAHEIRNPLAAITQASALLYEDLEEPGQRKLTEMVQHNAQRLARIVDDVLDVSRARQQRMLPLGEQLVLDVTVRTLAEEWVRQSQRQGVLVQLDTAGSAVRFDAEHLRRILVNLLDNAARYAGDREGAIQVATREAPNGRPVLQVWSDGAPLEAAVQRHLFEPFFSSESRSSGLGLFICRELCERHGASIGYERRALAANGPEGNEFYVMFAPAEMRISQ
ncbi:nitrogen regulation protein NR(II) [Variovorax sp. OV329]|uniref:two-component system sensor histidine kinase NtrB n=1 Tax=Variovorax sp. OV329 TaxID=1882825 RepID=UPI0008E9FB4D|nr:ATP-binding protein [Variovorax sp. OV329]SFM15954.1 two-component system, NtrC family, sensor histidine kinase PilS [Variovorax sp. OV329]